MKTSNISSNSIRDYSFGKYDNIKFKDKFHLNIRKVANNIHVEYKTFKTLLIVFFPISFIFLIFVFAYTAVTKSTPIVEPDIYNELTTSLNIKSCISLTRNLNNLLVFAGIQKKVKTNGEFLSCFKNRFTEEFIDEFINKHKSKSFLHHPLTIKVVTSFLLFSSRESNERPRSYIFNPIFFKEKKRKKSLLNSHLKVYQIKLNHLII